MARSSPASIVLPSVFAKRCAAVELDGAVLVPRQLQAARLSGTTIDALAELVLGRADLGQQRHRIERAIVLAQPPLHGLGTLGCASARS